MKEDILQVFKNGNELVDFSFVFDSKNLVKYMNENAKYFNSKSYKKRKNVWVGLYSLMSASLHYNNMVFDEIIKKHGDRNEIMESYYLTYSNFVTEHRDKLLRFDPSGNKIKKIDLFVYLINKAIIKYKKPIVLFVNGDKSYFDEATKMATEMSFFGSEPKLDIHESEVLKNIYK
jgi:hypothetical protein